MKNYKIGFTILISIFLLISCKKDKSQIQETAPLSFHWHTLVGELTAKYGTTYTSKDIKFNLSDFRYYISNIVLIKSDGTEYPISDKVLLINPSELVYPLDTLPVGNYKGFRFTLGLDSATNHKDPTTYDATSPLAVQSPSIYWTWSSGYIFMKVEGKYDSTIAQTGPIDQPFFYHIGTDMMKQTIDFSSHAFTITEGSNNTIHINMDVLKMLDKLDLRTENATHTMDNMPLATKVRNTWASVFDVE